MPWDVDDDFRCIVPLPSTVTILPPEEVLGRVSTAELETPESWNMADGVSLESRVDGRLEEPWYVVLPNLEVLKQWNDLLPELVEDCPLEPLEDEGRPITLVGVEAPPLPPLEESAMPIRDDEMQDLLRDDLHQDDLHQDDLQLARSLLDADRLDEAHELLRSLSRASAQGDVRVLLSELRCRLLARPLVGVGRALRLAG